MSLRRLPLTIFSFMLLPIMIGCSKTQFVVLRDVPESPSFAVIPANDYLDQVAFATEVEEAIISAGVKVIMFSQAAKEVTREIAVRGGIAAIEGNQAARKSGAGKLTERYVEFERTDVDYLVYTYLESGQVRIIKNQTREILAVLTVPINPVTKTHIPSMYHEPIADALKNMGIPTYQRKGKTKKPENMLNTP